MSETLFFVLLSITVAVVVLRQQATLDVKQVSMNLVRCPVCGIKHSVASDGKLSVHPMPLPPGESWGIVPSCPGSHLRWIRWAEVRRDDGGLMRGNGLHPGVAAQRHVEDR